MTDEILKMMDERRSFKNKNMAEYKRIQSKIRSKIRLEKQKWLKNECNEIENLQQSHDDFNLHKKIKEVSGAYRKTNFASLLNDNGQIILDSEDKGKRYGRNI